MTLGTSVFQPCFGAKIKNKKVVIFGLEDSGKSALLYRLKYDNHTLTEPTIGYNGETVYRHHKSKFRNKRNTLLKISCIDLPGSKSLRLTWNVFLDQEVDGLIFLVDVDVYLESEEYKSNCKKLLWETLDENELLDTCPLLVLLNKFDVATDNGKIINESTQQLNNTQAQKLQLEEQNSKNSSRTTYATIKKIYNELSLAQLTNRSYELRPCSVKTGLGLDPAIDWLGDVMLSKTECRDNVDIKSYNKDGNVLINKFKKSASSIKSSTSMIRQLDKQYPLTASISRTRKHIPFDADEDYKIQCQFLQQALEEKDLQNQKTFEQDENEDPEKSKEKLPIPAKRASASYTPPTWHRKIDTRLQQIDSALSVARQEQQSHRKLRMSMESAVEQGLHKQLRKNQYSTPKEQELLRSGERNSQAKSRGRRSTTNHQSSSTLNLINGNYQATGAGTPPERYISKFNPQKQQLITSGSNSMRQTSYLAMSDLAKLEYQNNLNQQVTRDILNQQQRERRVSTPNERPVLSTGSIHQSDISKIDSPVQNFNNRVSSRIRVKTPILHVGEFTSQNPPPANIYPNLEKFGKAKGKSKNFGEGDSELAKEFDELRSSTSTVVTSPAEVVLPDYMTDRSLVSKNTRSRPESRMVSLKVESNPVSHRSNELTGRSEQSLNTDYCSRIELQCGDEAISFSNSRQIPNFSEKLDHVGLKVSKRSTLKKLSQQDLRRKQFIKKYTEIFSSDYDD